VKILYHHRIASKDGQYVHVEELIKALRGRGHDVVVVAPRVVENNEFGSEGGWIAKLRAALPKSAYELLELAYSAVAFLKLRQAVLRHKPDCLYERYNLFLPAGIWISKRFKLPMLSEINAPLFDERSRFGGLRLKRLASWSERYVWCNASRVLPVTSVLARHVKDAGVAEDKIDVIHNGIDLVRFDGNSDKSAAKKELGLEENVVLGFTGFVRDWHGLDVVVEMLAEPGLEHAALLLVGDGPARDSLEQRARELGVRDRFKVTGVVSRERLTNYLAAFDIALQPAAVAYASPLKLFEYMAIDAAIIAPRQDNILEILTDGHDALLFNAGSHSDFREKLNTLFCDYGLRERLSCQARQSLIARGFTWQSNAERVETLFSELCERYQRSQTSEAKLN
jgi:glycosyltransferase involved in cell wall biosynthesis